MILTVSDRATFDKETASGHVLVDFFATWCGPCKMLKPIVEKVAQEHSDLKVLEIDVDQAQEIAALYNVYSIPTLVYFEDGKAIRQTVGYQPESSILKFTNLQ